MILSHNIKVMRNLAVDTLARKLVDSLEFIRGYHQRLLNDLRCLQVCTIDLTLELLC